MVALRAVSRVPVQVIRNISMWTFRSQEAMEKPEKEYRERTLWDPLVEPLLDLATETESHELLVEVRTWLSSRGGSVSIGRGAAHPGKTSAAEQLVVGVHNFIWPATAIKG